jgi:signal transduction histidine kinase
VTGSYARGRRVDYRVSSSRILTNNAARADSQAGVVIEFNSNNLTMSVSDNGIGITEIDISDPKSLGLLGMRERALVCGGQVEITGSKGVGTKVIVSIPIE